MCRYCKDSGLLEEKPMASELRPELQCLHYPERLLIARVQVTNLLFELPQGGMPGQYGRLYAVPLETPQVVNLFEDAELVSVDGVMYVAWPGQPVDKAVKVRAAELLTALEMLHQTNRHYKGKRIRDTIAKWRGKIPKPELSAVAGKKDDPWVADVTHFTSGGPAPVGADVAQLQQLRGLARLENGLDELMFPCLFPNGRNGWAGGHFGRYCRTRLLGCDTRFQESPEYVFWLMETWLKKQVSNQTYIQVGREVTTRGGRDELLQKVYAVLRSVPGTQQYMYAKRSMALRMIAQLGTPTFFLTLTSHELQPQLLLACAYAHLQGLAS
jgi:hypothetical protein